MNTVAMVMTLILCVTYAVVNYAYFALATGGLREEARMKLLQEEQDDRTMEVVQHLAQVCTCYPAPCFSLCAYG